MINDSQQQKWRVEPFCPSGKVRGVKRKGPATRFKPPRVMPPKYFKTPVIVYKHKPKQRMSWNDENREKLFRLHDEGKTWKEIGDEMGISREAVRREYGRCLENLRKKI